MVPTNAANGPLAIPPNCLRAINVLTDFLAADCTGFHPVWYTNCWKESTRPSPLVPVI